MTELKTQPDEKGHWGTYGGRFVPETLMAPLEELTAAYLSARDNSSFQSELATLLRDYAGRPTPLFYAARLTENAGGAKIYLKREDLLTPALTRSTTRLARCCWLAEWASDG